MPSPAACSSATLVLETATSRAGTRSVTSQGILNPGSSKQGNARRASIDSNCVYAAQPAVVRLRYAPYASVRNRPEKARCRVAGPAGSDLEGTTRATPCRSSVCTVADTRAEPARTSADWKARPRADTQRSWRGASSTSSTSTAPRKSSRSGTTSRNTRSRPGWTSAGRRKSGGGPPASGTCAATTGVVAAAGGGEAVCVGPGADAHPRTRALRHHRAAPRMGSPHSLPSPAELTAAAARTAAPPSVPVRGGRAGESRLPGPDAARPRVQGLRPPRSDRAA